MKSLNKRQVLSLCLSLFFAASLLTGCSASLKKPELKPAYSTSTPIATNLRKSTAPGSLKDYLNFPDLQNAKSLEDPNLARFEEIPRLSSVPSGFFPTFSAGPEEVMVSYSDSNNSDRKFVIYGTYSNNPDQLLNNLSEETFFERETIAGNYYYILTQAEAVDQEAYTIRGNWFIHMSGYGMEATDFRSMIEFIELASLSSDTQ